MNRLTMIKNPSKQFLPYVFLSLLSLGQLFATQANAQDANAPVAATSAANPVAPATVPSTKAKSVVVARVNGEEITEEQLNSEAAPNLQGVTDPQQIAQIKAAVLNDMINQAVVLQVANKAGLANTPEAQLQIDQLRKKALFGYYINNQIGSMPQVKEQAVDDFIRKHPELIDQHKTYHYQQIIFPAGEKDHVVAIQGIVQRDGNMVDIKSYLKTNKIASVSTNLWRGSEQISPATLADLTPMKAGQIKVMLTPDRKNIQVLKLVDVYPDPITLEEARIPIVRGVQLDARDKMVKDLLSGLRSRADIEISDPKVAKEVSRVIAQSATAAPATLRSKISTAWYFALMALIPAAAILFYKTNKPVPVEKSVHDLANFSAEPLFKVTLHTLRIPFLLILSIWLLAPMFEFFSSPPVWVTLQTLITLAFSGLAVGIAIDVVLWKLPIVKKIPYRGWIALIALIVGRLVLS